MIDRRAILFSSVLCLCKGTSNEKWKLKEKISLKKFNIDDRIILSNQEYPYAFEIQTDDRNVVLATGDEQEKAHWLCLLIYIRNKKYIDSPLDNVVSRFSYSFLSILQHDLYNLLINEDAQQILLTPDPTRYK